MKFNFHSTGATRTGAAAFSLSIALGLSLSLSGCGGGGGNGPGTSRPTVTATPTLNASNASYNKTLYTPNYVSDLESKKTSPEDPVALLRWPLFPLRVYFNRNSNYTAARQALAVEGFNRWVKATGSDGVTYQVVNDLKNANITVDYYTFEGGPGDTLGFTKYFYDPDSRVFDTSKSLCSINIGLTGDRNNDLVTATHEFGHALGINEHSSSRPDLMYFEGNDLFGGGITQSDVDTLLTSYSGFFNKNPNARTAPSSGKLVQVTIE